MHQAPHNESGTATVEFAALVGSVAVLCAGLALAMPAGAGRMAGQIRHELTQAVVSPEGARHSFEWHTQSGRTSRLGAPIQSARVRTPRLTPPAPASLHGPAWYRAEVHRTGSADHGRLTWSSTASMCALCVDSNWSTDFSNGSRAELVRETGHTAKAGFSNGFEAALDASAQAAIVAVTTGATARWHRGPVDLRAGGQTSAVVGATAQAQGVLRLQRAHQELELGGRAVAGATGRMQAHASAHVMSIGIEQALGAEGWAGIGAAGHAQVTNDHGKFHVQLAAGAALGLGGQLDAQTTVDLRHLKAAAQASAATAARFMRRAW